MMRRLKSLSVLASLLVLTAWFSTACSTRDESAGKKTAPTAEDVRRESRETLETSKEYAAEKKREYQKEMEAKLQDLSRQIDELKAKARRSKAKTRAQLEEQLSQLEKKRDETRKKLDELESAGADTWAAFKAKLEAAMSDLEQSFKRAISSFK